MNNPNTPVGFLGLGAYVPEKVLTNFDLEKMVDTSDEWIVTRTGIRERHICEPGQAASDLAAQAARRAIADAGIDAEQIDMIICCTFTGDHSCPNTACIIQQKLGISRLIPCFDLSAACSGFLYGCSVANGFIQTMGYKHVLVVGVEVMSSVLDFTDRNTCVLFGDGAGAVVLGPVEEGRGLLGQSLGADGAGTEAIIVPASGSSEPVDQSSLEGRRNFLKMAGNDVYKFATRVCGKAILEALNAAGNGYKPQDLDVIVPHQANVRIIEVAAKKLDLPMDRFVLNLDRYGNTSAASVPLAMATARDEGRIKEGTLLGLVAFGGGLTYAASIWRW